MFSPGKRLTTSAPNRRRASVRCIHAQHQLRAPANRGFNLGGVKTVDRDAQALVSQCLDGIANTTPGTARIATEVDEIAHPDERSVSPG